MSNQVQQNWQRVLQHWNVMKVVELQLLQQMTQHHPFVPIPQSNQVLLAGKKKVHETKKTMRVQDWLAKRE
jgi:hypothetical protein